jgi:hypothetical protein
MEVWDGSILVPILGALARNPAPCQDILDFGVIGFGRSNISARQATDLHVLSQRTRQLLAITSQRASTTTIARVAARCLACTGRPPARSKRAVRKRRALLALFRQRAPDRLPVDWMTSNLLTRSKSRFWLRTAYTWLTAVLNIKTFWSLCSSSRQGTPSGERVGLSNPKTRSINR